MIRRVRYAAALVAGIALAEAVLIHLGRTFGSTRQERATHLPGDQIVSKPQVVTDHAITINAPADCVWPWLVQMGWHRAGWYTARWVDRLLFPLNWPSANRIIPELQNIKVGDFIPDGAPETRCGLIVEHLESGRAMALHSTSHLPIRWRDKASLDWSWAFVLFSVDDGARTRFHFRSRWVARPWWFTLGGWLAIVPADFLMSHDMLQGVRQRAEDLARQRSASSYSIQPARVAVSTRALDTESGFPRSGA